MKSKNEAERWFRWLRWVGVWMSCRESQMEPKVKPLIAFFSALCIALQRLYPSDFVPLECSLGLCEIKYDFLDGSGSLCYLINCIPKPFKMSRAFLCFIATLPFCADVKNSSEFFFPILSRKWTDYEDERQRKAIKEKWNEKKIARTRETRRNEV